MAVMIPALSNKKLSLTMTDNSGVNALFAKLTASQGCVNFLSIFPKTITSMGWGCKAKP